MKQGDPQIETPSTRRLVYWELLMALRSNSVLVALAIFGVLLAIAIALGVLRTQTRQADARFAEEENQMVKEVIRNVLQGTPALTETTKDDSSRQSRITKQLRMTAKSPYLVSHASNLWDVSLFPSPLSALSVGSSQTWPDVYRIDGISLSETVRRDEQVRPVTSAYGPFDVAFVVMAIAPLVVIGLTFNVSSRDRELGLQNLTLAQTGSLGKLMAVRCFVRAALVIGLVACIVNGALLITLGDQFDSNVVVSLVIWNVMATIYLLIWAALSFFVNALAKTSSTNGAALLLLWLILVLLIPKFVSYAVQQTVRTRPESALADREKETFDEESENVDDLVKSFQSEHPEIEIRLDDQQQVALVKYLLAHDAAGGKAAENVRTHYGPQSLRAKYLSYSDWISPAISFRNQSDQCSGNSEQAFVAFSAHAADVQAQVMETFLLPSITNQECTVETMAGLPSLQETDIPKRPALLNSIVSIVSMLVWLTILVCLGGRQFRANHSKNEHTSLRQNKGGQSA